MEWTELIRYVDTSGAPLRRCPECTVRLIDDGNVQIDDKDLVEPVFTRLSASGYLEGVENLSGDFDVCCSMCWLSLSSFENF